MQKFNECYQYFFGGFVRSIAEALGQEDVLTKGDNSPFAPDKEREYYQARSLKVSSLKNADFILSKAGWVAKSKPTTNHGIVTYSKGKDIITVSVDLLGNFEALVQKVGSKPEKITDLNALTNIL